MKVQISIKDELLQKIDEEAKNNFMTRSGYISYIITQHLKSNEKIQNNNDIKTLDLFKK